MIQTESSITIKADIDEVYNFFTDFRSYPEFVPYCKYLRILSNTDNVMITEMEIKVNGVSSRKKSKVFFDKEKKHLRAEQLEGFLKDLKWDVSMKEEAEGVKVVSRHQFEVGIPLIGDLIGKFIISRFWIKKVEWLLLESMKEKIESLAGR